MTSKSEQPALPLRRDWSAWLFLLLAVLAIVVVLQLSSTSPATLVRHRAAAPPALPAQVIPEVLPMEFTPITSDDAKAANELVPLVKSDFITARPFTYPGNAENRDRARDCLAAAMIYEAGDDGKDQRAVGQVIINRVRHPAFPKSICAVVFQGSERRTGCQFTFTCDGALNRRYSDAAWKRAQATADTMLSGSVDRQVGLATHYHTNWVLPYWSGSLEKIAVVDTHLFFRWPGYWGTLGAFRGAVKGSDAPVPKLAAISTAHAPAQLALDANAAAGAARLIPGKGETVGRDTIFILLDRRAPAESFVTLALRLCGTRDYCKFMGWTNPVLKPSGDAMSDTARASMSFSYLRDEKAGFEKALWNCSEYMRDDNRQCMKR